MNIRTNRKIFHICLLIVVITALFFVTGVVILRYHVEGEKDLPFKISSIKIISSVEGIDQKDGQNKWNMSINQNNDIYLYIEKGNDFGKVDVIENVVLDNFNVKRENEIGTNNIYMPSSKATYIFENKESFKTQSIRFDGALEQDIKNLKISNQGGLIAFRCANDNIGNYVSNEDEEINHNKLLEKINKKPEDFNSEISFDITINLTSKKVYKSSINLKILPTDFSKTGSSSQEINETNDIIFKRVEN